MAYPKIKLPAATKEIDLTPAFLKEIGDQVSGQICRMSYGEMLGLWSAGKSVVAEIKKVPAIANVLNLFGVRS